MATNIEREYLGRDGAEQLVAKIKYNYVTKAAGWSELEDKPFGELSTGSDTLYWDGNREGLVRADDYEQYLISESVPTLDDFANGASNTKLDGDTETSTNLGLNTSIYEVGDGAIVVGNSIVALKDGATVGDTTYPKKGTYFTWIGNDCYTTSLTIPGYNGFPSEKQLDAKWLPNHTHTIGPAPITTEGTGAAYTATVDGITALETGLSFTMIPHTASTSATATLNVNGLGAKMLRRPLSANNATTVANSTASWLYANKPVEVMYNGTYWIVTSMPRPNGPDIYGTVPVANGGVPSATTSDNGKVLTVVDGDPAWADNHITIKSVSESSEDGGSNVVTFSDGGTLTVKNGSKGNTGDTGLGVYLFDSSFPEEGNGLLPYEIVTIPDDRSLQIGDALIDTYNVDGSKGNVHIVTGTYSDGFSKSDTLLNITGSKGEKGDTGQRGTGLISITTIPSEEVTTAFGVTTEYKISTDTVKAESGVSDVQVGDIIECGYYHYPVLYANVLGVYCGTRVSIRGATPVKGTDYYTEEDKTEMVTMVKEALPTETWTFTLSDGSTITKTVPLIS